MAKGHKSFPAPLSPALRHISNLIRLRAVSDLLAPGDLSHPRHRANSQLQRANNSFKPTPLRGVVVTSSHPSVPASATLPQRRGLIQALGRSQQVFRPRAFKSRSKPISCCWQRQQGHLPNDSFARHGHSSGVAQTRYPSTVVGVDRKQHRSALHSGQRSLSAVKSIAGQRPNNSFKPNPLRGSA